METLDGSELFEAEEGLETGPGESLETPEGASRLHFFESCRAPEGYDSREQLLIAQALAREELRALRDGLREEGVDSGRWAERVIVLEAEIAARERELAALAG